MTRKRNPSRPGTICRLFPDKDFLAFPLSSARLENHWSEKWSVAVLERERQKKSDLLNSLRYTESELLWKTGTHLGAKCDRQYHKHISLFFACRNWRRRFSG